MPAAGFEAAIPAIERLQVLSLDYSATGIGCKNFSDRKIAANRTS
jgi:hypothetical protein